MYATLPWIWSKKKRKKKTLLHTIHFILAGGCQEYRKLSHLTHLSSTHIGENMVFLYLFNLIFSSEGLVGSELIILCLFAQILHSFRNTYICKQ